MHSKEKGIQSKASKTTNKLSLQHNDQAHIKYSDGWKAGPKAPPTQLPYVLLHAAEFIKLSVQSRKRPSTVGFPPANMPPELDCVFEHCALHGWGRIPHHNSDTRSCLLFRAVPFPSVFFFFLTSMLVKQYIQQLTDLFDGNEELIYGHAFIITHNSSLQALYPVEILGFFCFSHLEVWGSAQALIL